ncbi:hypothetical protein, unlikely [Trypanosoma brucei brucei TREU927]|uniref:T. brucei spp.-specific protein n=1 Tax=Trypanosoma brucei brucei (strain 927/4 GUTat10.1) TaxID=185431 RepID=Q387P5_TRYB2|nr:hypothetical protein, unlikely [Trypanosoma brucei brucei TREU927]EAN78977.1 hypothetical protein, unlikely [Trypanosoma brucei brucei TREU927]
MEVPPFLFFTARPNLAAQFPSGAQHPVGFHCAGFSFEVMGCVSGRNKGSVCCVWVFLSLPSSFPVRASRRWRWKWGAPTRLETRTKESNRRAREEYVCENSFLVLKGRCDFTPVACAISLFCVFAQRRPAPRGLRASVPVWTRKVVNYA